MCHFKRSGFLKPVHCVNINMTIQRNSPKSCGFTKIELLVVLLVCCILAELLFACLRSPRQVSSRLTCTVNLKQMGVAAQLFSQSYGGYPWAVSTNSGGTLEFGAMGEQTFRHLQVLSNDIYVTVVVVCPQDVRQPAPNWLSMANSNISYFIGIDSNPALPTSIVAGDRNIAQMSGVVLESVLSAPPKWVKSVGLHGIKGNLLFSDGHAEKVSSAGLRKALLRTGIVTNHFSIP